MPPAFFLAYARPHGQADRELVATFFEHLRTEVAGLLAIDHDKVKEVGFLDEDALRVGQNWPRQIGKHLCEASVLVCFYSPAFFLRKYCGREVGAWVQRTRLADRNGPPLRNIIPVIWDPRYPAVPAILEDVQKGEAREPDLYKRHGLQLLMKLKNRRGHKDALVLLIYQLAERIRDLAENRLPALDPVPQYRKLPNAWDPNEIGEPGGARSTSGARLVRCFLLVGKPAEMKRFRDSVGNYDEDQRFWRPYDPTENRGFLAIVRDVSADLKLLVETTPVQGDEIGAKLDQAKECGNVVVVVVDNWSMGVDRIKKAVRAYDVANWENACLLIVRNEDCPETAQSSQRLQAWIKELLPNKSEHRAHGYCWYPLPSVDSFCNELPKSVSTVRARMLSGTNGGAEGEAGAGTVGPWL